MVPQQTSQIETFLDRASTSAEVWHSFGMEACERADFLASFE
jgi:hypothetical protein